MKMRVPSRGSCLRRSLYYYVSRVSSRGLCVRPSTSDRIPLRCSVPSSCSRRCKANPTISRWWSLEPADVSSLNRNQRLWSRSTSSGQRRGGCGPRLTNDDGRPGDITSSENACRGGGSCSHANPIRRASSSDAMRSDTPVTSRDAFNRAAVHRVERVYRRNDQQFHRFSFFFGHCHHVRKEFLLV